MRKALLGVALALWLAPAGHAATRIIYASDWTGPTALFAIRPQGGAPLGQLTTGFQSPCIQEFFACGFSDPLPSPDGRRLLYRNAVLSAAVLAQFQSLWLAQADGTGVRLIVPGGDYAGPAAWAPNSRRFAYVTRAGVWVARQDGSGAHLVSTVAPRSLGWSPDSRALVLLEYPQGPSPSGPARLMLVRDTRTRVLATIAGGASVDWSPNGQWLAVSGENGSDAMTLVSAANGRRRRAVGSGSDARWSPNGRYLASATTDGLLLVDTRSGHTRLLTKDTACESPNCPKSQGFVWGPDGRSIAYLTTGVRNDFVAQGDLKVVTLTGRVRTLVAGTSTYGGRILSVAWTRAPSRIRYTKPSVTPTGTIADGPVMQLATDGESVAFATTCNRVSVWKPLTNFLFTTAQAPLVGVGPYCDWGERWEIYTLALAGERLIYGFNQGGLSSLWWLRELTVSQPQSGVQLDSGSGPLGGPWTHALGTAVGSGSLIAYSFWDETSPPIGPPFHVTTQTIQRADPGGCTCPVLASSPGPLVPFDVSNDRIVASGDRETIVFDQDGKELLSLPVSALGAQFDGNHFIVLIRGELRDYDLHSGALVHTTMLPDIDSGSECGSPHYCDRRPPRLLLEDARDGLVTYVLDGQVHLRRIADGQDATVAAGSLARFFKDGLVYAYGARISVVPFDRLPLRGF